MKTSATHASPPPFLKRGLGSCSQRTTTRELGQLNLGWYYNWRPFPIIHRVPGVEFVPMIWSTAHMRPDYYDMVVRNPSPHLLGFNEPDMAGQANMTPGECLDMWPELMSLGKRLGSPAPATAEWLDDFMPEARRRGLRVDFICLHLYPDISDPDVINRIATMLDTAHSKYGLPIWFTECGAADISAWNQTRLSEPTPAMAESFLRQYIELLEGMPFVERYAWFADRIGGEYALGSIFNPDAGGLTPMGEIYRDGK